MAWFVPILAGAMLAAACGDEAPSTPAPTPSTTPLLSLATSTSGATSPAIAAEPSPAAGEMTVGQIADRIAAAWPTVRTYRTTLRTSAPAPGAATPVASPFGSPAARVPEIQIVDEVVLPNRRHRAQLVDGRIAGEIIVIDGAVYIRGVVIPGATPIASDPNAWALLDPAAEGGDSRYRQLHEGATAPILPPYAGLSEDERARIARPVGVVTVAGQRCDAFQVADTTQTGERIDVVIAIGADDLPCSIETIVGESVSVTTFEFNVPLSIEPPR